MPSTPLQMRRRRIRLIRRRVVASATAIFMASTGWIFVELVSGHDPALARSQTTTNTTSTSTTASVSGSSPANSSSSSSSDVSPGSPASASSGSATAVTTSAS